GAVFVEDYITPVSSSKPARIENSTFTHNKASDMGGAIYNEGNLRVKNTTFGNSSKKTSYANTAENGGAAVANCGNGIFTSTASNYYYSSGYKGGAIFNTDSAITHIEGGTLNNNVATYGGAIFNDVNATLTLDAFDNAETGKWVYISMSKNSAVYGGAIYNQGSIVFDENVYNLSGSYISNTATYDDPNTKIKGQKIIIKDYGQGSVAEANRA
ncbi:hypothetical protein IKJ53_00010, partial [bacterium]|nr:hypothetical protein [bacterium]